MIPSCARERDLLLSISGVGETLAGVVLAELPGPDVLRSSAEVVAYAGLKPAAASIGGVRRSSEHASPRLATLPFALPCTCGPYPPCGIIQPSSRWRLGWKSRGRLKPKQIVVAAMGKLLVLCFGVRLVKNRQTLRCRDSEERVSHIKALITLTAKAEVKPRSPKGRTAVRWLDACLRLQHASMPT